jgi:WD40 repeat protein
MLMKLPFWGMPGVLGSLCRICRHGGGLVALLLIATGAIAPVHAEIAATDQPILRIETGTHTAVVGGIASSPDAQQIVTASDDTTLRLWSLPGLDLQRPFVCRPVSVPRAKSIRSPIRRMENFS